MEKNEVSEKAFLTDSKFIIIDVNNPNVLTDLEIEDFSLNDGMVLNIQDFTYKLLYNDVDNPLVLEKTSSINK